MSIEPLYEEIPIFAVSELLAIFSSNKDLALLHSAANIDNHGNYSFIGLDAFANFLAKDKHFFWQEEKIETANPFDFIKQKINQYTSKKIAELPPFQGGAIGFFGYEAGHYLEELPLVEDSIGLPDIYIAFYSTVIIIAHEKQQSWIVATGFPTIDEACRKLKAQQDIAAVKKRLQDFTISSPAIPHVKEIQKNFNAQNYKNMVLKAQEYIKQGDIFEVNLALSYQATLSDNSNIAHLYSKLMHHNPAPYSAFIKLPNNNYILSASPERFLLVVDGQVEACPIKGTRKRGITPEEDKTLAQELLQSEKDRAENIMIVDLIRNDLSRVCEPHSVEVKELCALKSFASVHHLVSTITGKLKSNITSLDLLKATFPPGSITGAPKIRAMEIISELEKQQRGPYCGVIGYISFHGDMDTSVIIRTFNINDKSLFFNAGSAIVLDSSPDEEYLECQAKAHALIEALNTCS